ncbi:MAG: AMP-binding protein [Deltaproteobacteria bacterium]|nr:AMP-binding protein [Deltaproteobacteria bacterium]
MSQNFNMTDYDKEYSEFKWDIPEKFNFAGDVIDKWAKDPNKLAIQWVDDDGNEKTRTFTELSSISKKVCNAFTRMGIKRGDVLIIMLGREVEWWEIFTACVRMGVVISPGTTQLTSKDIKYRMNYSKSVCFITDKDNAPKLEEVESDCELLRTKIIIGSKRDGWLNYDDEIAKENDSFETADTRHDEESMVYFTSGTTGNPKMTLHTHSYGLAHQTTGKYWLDHKPEDLHWNVSDNGWAKAAWSSYFGPWNMGAALFIHCSPVFTPEKTLELLQKYPITTMCGAPTIYRLLVLQDLSKYSFPELRHCVGAGEPLNPEVIEIWKKATDTIIRDGYGQTESVLLCGSYLCIEPRFGSMGKPSPGVDLQIIDNDGNICPPDTEGDIAINVKVKPAGLFKEYWNEPEKTASCYNGDWYLTGDRATRDSDGYFWFVGRSDDVILSSGYRIGPFEVESALIEHESVAESAVVSSPDEKRGEIVKAFIVLAPGFTAGDGLKKEIQDHVKKVTAPYKYPRAIDFVTELPKTVSGKIRRVELRDAEWK